MLRFALGFSSNKEKCSSVNFVQKLTKICLLEEKRLISLAMLYIYHSQKWKTFV